MRSVARYSWTALATGWLLIAGSGAEAQAVLDGCIEDTYNAFGSGAGY